MSLYRNAGRGQHGPTSVTFKPIDVPGYEDFAFGLEGSYNALFFQSYLLYAAVPVGDNIVIVITGWAQKSRKYLASTLTKAIDKVATAAGIESPAVRADASP